ncbi:tRNA guanosine(34) transglycosylase Tgt [Candidatus Peregrinibacteria bacterium]|nr:tRNA guanosine(34) transglycosylase Tgt [Candidatus Peregrinibacteria bacterium]
MFSLVKTTPAGRRGRVVTTHGDIETPFFMPVGTAGTMKGLTHGDILSLGAEILLCNTYHLFLQPGDTVIADAGGLHKFISWNKPMLTDSGGFQVFSLESLRKISDNGVEFRSHINGDRCFLGPRESIAVQWNLGADIIMCFDQCPPSTAARSEIIEAVDRTLLWAKECKREHEERKQTKASSGSSEASVAPLLFGIVQGGLERDLRKKCAEELIAMGFDGYAVGGLAVGETQEEMYAVLDDVCPLLPQDKLRYLMGVGVVEQLRACVQKGIDMFDCVLPMRIARHGKLLVSDGSEIRILASAYRDDHSIIDPDSPSDLSRIHRKSYLHHLFKANERYAETIACKQNLGVTLKAMQELRNGL